MIKSCPAPGEDKTSDIRIWMADGFAIILSARITNHIMVRAMIKVFPSLPSLLAANTFFLIENVRKISSFTQTLHIYLLVSNRNSFCLFYRIGVNEIQAHTISSINDEEHLKLLFLTTLQ